MSSDAFWRGVHQGASCLIVIYLVGLVLMNGWPLFLRAGFPETKMWWNWRKGWVDIHGDWGWWIVVCLIWPLAFAVVATYWIVFTILRLPFYTLPTWLGRVLGGTSLSRKLPKAQVLDEEVQEKESKREDDLDQDGYH